MDKKETKIPFTPVDPQISFPQLEEEMIAFWKENKTFEKSVDSRPQDKTWTFLDGPPFVTGLPHYGHLLTSIAKDLFPRFWTMKGYRVRRVWGWDGHGLPIENKVENKLEIKRKKDIEETVGVKKFIDECKQYVEQVSDEWEWYVDHVGRWVDFKHAYKTWDMPYMESVMWVFKQMYEKKLVYKGLRVSLYCPHCATPISNFEVAMDADNYKELSDAATTYKYELENQKSKVKSQKEGEKTFILAWSTTPWNKIVVPALAVNPKLTYVKVKQNNEYYILAKSTLKMLNNSMSSRAERGDLTEKKIAAGSMGPRNDNGDNYQIVEEFKGSELIGKKYVPHYDYYPITPGKKAFEIIPGDFVTAEEGTGVVTVAAYGEEDLKASQENNIHIEMHLDEEGNIKPDVPLFGGMYYLKANKFVNEDLAKRGLIYKDEQLNHNVPLCWRCHTRLYNAPITAWYVNVQVLKEEMKKTNEQVNWIPSYFKHGRFLKSLENAPDWNISRNRYWGSPVPVWECQPCEWRFVPGSVKELEEKSGQKVTELHKPDIDQIIVKCDQCGKEVHRVPEVLDSWIEAGSASFAERHYPFVNTPLKDFYPPDFIVEYTGQIRAWFYVLHVISNALYQSIAFKNVAVTGVILGTDGRKMSKNLGNYPDPKDLLEKYGGDALRLYLMSSPVVQGEDMVISEENYRNQVRGFLLILWNVYNFFVSNALVDKYQVSSSKYQVSKNVLDQWVMSLLHSTIKEVTKALEEYNTVKAVETAQAFINNLSTWYIRRSRDRVGAGAQDETDKQAFYQTTYTVLTIFTKVIAPLTPFVAEAMYKNLTNEESVHLTDWPQVDESLINKALETQMEEVRVVIERGHAKRKELEIKVKQPLKEFKIQNAKFKINEDLLQLVQDELNVKEVSLSQGDGEMTVSYDTTMTDELRSEGELRDIIRSIQGERKKLGTRMDEYIDVILPSWPGAFTEDIKRKTFVRNLTKGSEFLVKKI